MSQIRGRGLMIGIELDRPCADLVKQALDAGLLINVTAERVIRLLPPLILEQAEADLLLRELSELIRRFLEAPATRAHRGTDNMDSADQPLRHFLRCWTSLPRRPARS